MKLKELFDKSLTSNGVHSDGLIERDESAKSLTDEEIEELTDELTPEDLERAISTRTPAMQALLKAKDGGL